MQKKERRQHDRENKRFVQTKVVDQMTSEKGGGFSAHKGSGADDRIGRTGAQQTQC